MTGTLLPVLHGCASHEHLTSPTPHRQHRRSPRRPLWCRRPPSLPSPTLPARPSTATLPKSFKPLKALTNASGFRACKTITTASALTENSSRDNSSRPWSSMPTTSPVSPPRLRPKASACPSPSRLLRPLLRQRPPSVAQLGRWAHAAAQQADALLPVLDAVARPRVEQAAADEIFFGRRPCLMVVEQHSLCRLAGRLADDRNGDTWAEEFRRLPKLRQVTRDGGTGLAKGVAVVNQERQAQGQDALADQEDHFHTLREGRRALRQRQQRVCRRIDEAAAAHHRERRKALRRTGKPTSSIGYGHGAGRTPARPRPWKPGRPRKRPGRRSPTPCGCSHRQGSWNTRARAEGIIATAVAGVGRSGVGQDAAGAGAAAVPDVSGPHARATGGVAVAVRGAGRRGAGGRTAAASRGVVAGLKAPVGGDVAGRAAGDEPGAGAGGSRGGRGGGARRERAASGLAGEQLGGMPERRWPRMQQSGGIGG